LMGRNLKWESSWMRRREEHVLLEGKDEPRGSLTCRSTTWQRSRCGWNNRIQDLRPLWEESGHVNCRVCSSCLVTGWGGLLPKQDPISLLIWKMRKLTRFYL
jgi:hypothetical protein